MIKIGYDAGHAKYTAGKRTPDDEREWTFNNIVAVAFANELSKYKDVELKRFDDPTGEKDIILGDRTKAVNAWGADYHFSFHHNALLSKWGTHGGVETFIYTSPSTKQVAMANAIHPSLVKGYGLRDRGVKKQDLAICRDIKKNGERVGILLEGGFMDSTTDIKVLRNKEMLQNAGVLIAQAVANHLKLSLKERQSIKQAEEKTTNVSIETFKKEAIAEIKNAVKDGRFTSPHTDVENYTYEDLQNYMMIALARRK